MNIIRNGIVRNILVLLIGVLGIPVAYVILLSPFRLCLQFIDGDWILAVIMVVVLVCIPILSGYTITHYLAPMRWWTPLLAFISIILVLGVYTMTGFWRTGEWFGENSVVEVIYQLSIAGSFLLGGYARFVYFLMRNTINESTEYNKM